MITLFLIFLMVSMFVGGVKMLTWMVSAAFHLIPFLIGVVFFIGVLAIAGALFSAIGSIIVFFLIIGACVRIFSRDSV